MPLSTLAGAIVLSAVLGGSLLVAMFFVHIIGQIPEENNASNHLEEDDYKEAKNYFYGLVCAVKTTEITNTKLFENLSRPLYHYLHFNDAETLINLPPRLIKSNRTSVDGHTLSIMEVGVPASNNAIQNENCPICNSSFEKKPFQLTNIQLKEINTRTGERTINYKHKEETTPPCIDCQTNLIQQCENTDVLQNNPEVLAAAHL